MGRRQSDLAREERRFLLRHLLGWHAGSQLRRAGGARRNETDRQALARSRRRRLPPRRHPHLFAGGPRTAAERPARYACLPARAGADVRSVRPEAVLVGENWTETAAIVSYYGSTAAVAGGDELPRELQLPARRRSRPGRGDRRRGAGRESSLRDGRSEARSGSQRLPRAKKANRTVRPPPPRRARAGRACARRRREPPRRPNRLPVVPDQVQRTSQAVGVPSRRRQRRTSTAPVAARACRARSAAASAA